MRSALALAILVTFATSAHADDELVHTREVLRRHADASRTRQTIGGIAMIASGVALGGAGYYVLANVQEGGFIDLSDLERAFGYSMIGVGGLSILSGTLLLVVKNHYETMADQVTDAQDARFARTEIAHHAAAGRRTRTVVRIVGLTLAGVGALGATIALAGGESIDRSTRNELLGAGIAFGIFGTGFTVGSLFETRWEKMHDDLQAVRTPVTAAFVPVRGGAMLGVGGSF